MKIIISITIIFSALILISCSNNDNPVSPEVKVIPPGGYCEEFLELDFADTCSYNFVTTFLAGFDSVSILYTQLGSEFYIYADRGDFNYWSDYFKNDSTIQYLSDVSTTQDSLIILFVLNGKRSIHEEKLRFNSINHLQIINIIEQNKTVDVEVPEGSEVRWGEIFKEYDFISEVYIIGVCTVS